MYQGVCATCGKVNLTDEVEVIDIFNYAKCESCGSEMLLEDLTGTQVEIFEDEIIIVN